MRRWITTHFDTPFSNRRTTRNFALRVVDIHTPSKNVIGKTVCDGLLRSEVSVFVGSIGFDLRDRLPCCFGKVGVEDGTDAADMGGGADDRRCTAAHLSQRLMEHHLAVARNIALALRSADSGKKRRHRCGMSRGDGHDIASAGAHCIQNGKSCVHRYNRSVR